MQSSKLNEIYEKFKTLKQEKELLKDDIKFHIDGLRTQNQISEESKSYAKEKLTNDLLHNRLLELTSKLKSTTAERNYYKDKVNGGKDSNLVFTCPICQWSTSDSVKLQLHVQDCIT